MSADGYVKLRIILLNVPWAILRTKFLNHCRDSVRLRERSHFQCCALTPRIDLHLGMLEHILIPLRVRTVHRKKVERVALRDKPNRVGDVASRFSAGDGDPEFVIARQAVS